MSEQNRDVFLAAAAAARAGAGAGAGDGMSPVLGRRRTRGGDALRAGAGARAPPRYRHLSGSADLPERLLDEAAVYGFVDG